jgi:CRISPR/Cas system-associated endoribonuclease Cas2
MKAKIKNDLRKKLHENFTKRLQDSRKDLEANRARLLRMENELKKRENKQDAIVEAMLTNLLSGNKTSQKK